MATKARGLLQRRGRPSRAPLPLRPRPDPRADRALPEPRAHRVGPGGAEEHGRLQRDGAPHARASARGRRVLLHRPPPALLALRRATRSPTAPSRSESCSPRFRRAQRGGRTERQLRPIKGEFAGPGAPRGRVTCCGGFAAYAANPASAGLSVSLLDVVDRDHASDRADRGECRGQERVWRLVADDGDPDQERQCDEADSVRRPA